MAHVSRYAGKYRIKSTAKIRGTWATVQKTCPPLDHHSQWLVLKGLPHWVPDILAFKDAMPDKPDRFARYLRQAQSRITRLSACKAGWLRQMPVMKMVKMVLGECASQSFAQGRISSTQLAAFVNNSLGHQQSLAERASPLYSQDHHISMLCLLSVIPDDIRKTLCHDENKPLWQVITSRTE